MNKTPQGKPKNNQNSDLLNWPGVVGAFVTIASFGVSIWFGVAMVFVSGILVSLYDGKLRYKAPRQRMRVIDLLALAIAAISFAASLSFNYMWWLSATTGIAAILSFFFGGWAISASQKVGEAAWAKLLAKMVVMLAFWYARLGAVVNLLLLAKWTI